jgi:oxygen-independent coproporphyrinogen-3 oxidase
MRHKVETPRALYVHIPFCTNKCHYCDFNSVVHAGQPVEAYLDALENEMVRTVHAVVPQHIDTVFIGGGTPTVLTPAQLQRLLANIRMYFLRGQRDDDVEVTMEANPGTTSQEKLCAMKEGGVNRLSFGVQSFDPALLQTLGRIHGQADVYTSVAQARTVGFTNISLDLMYGLPNQTVHTLAQSVSYALALDVPHLSIYGLKVEEQTRFYQLYQRGELPLPSEDEEVEMYERIRTMTTEQGYAQYEVSNFAKPGYASIHNCVYWRNESYYGIGAGAHGYVRGVRHMNIKGVAAYIDAAQRQLPRADTQDVPPKEAMEDFMMVGLRMCAGVTQADFIAQFGMSWETLFGEVIERLLARKWIRRTVGGIALTEEGLFFGNDVFGAFLEHVGQQNVSSRVETI